MAGKVYLIFLFSFAFHTLLPAQNAPDSLQHKSFSYLSDRINRSESDSGRVQLYLDAYLSKARHEKNNREVVNAYENLIYFSESSLRLSYADSMIAAAKRTSDNEIIGYSYLMKGHVYYEKKIYPDALNNYLIANGYVSRSENTDLLYRSRHAIANIKFYLGFYKEAEQIFNECAKYFKGKDEGGYLASLHSLGLCYNKLNRFDLCSSTNELAMKEAERQHDTLSISYIQHSEGINQYFKKNYDAAIKQMNLSLPVIADNEDFASESVANFYLGKSYLALGAQENALNYFRKVDRTFSEKNYVRPDLRENFEILINYYKEQDNTKIQLHYINKLIKADSILSQNFKYLSGKIHKEYDTRELMQAKNEIENELASTENTAYILYITVTVLFFLILFLLYRYYTTQRKYRDKFEELMLRQNGSEIHADEDEKPENKRPDINPEVVAAIMKQLEKFENQKKFLQKDLTLVTLASTFSTNSNYLSKVINYSRNKNYINYLNDLRIDYIVDLLKNDSKYRNYTIKALAEEAGFSTAQHFSKAFFARTGIYPSYFINEISREYPVFSLI